MVFGVNICSLVLLGKRSSRWILQNKYRMCISDFVHSFNFEPLTVRDMLFFSYGSGFLCPSSSFIGSILDSYAFFSFHFCAMASILVQWLSLPSTEKIIGLLDE
ncbi:hypothetical protein NMG60_11024106 [Bertholletia excelsa]